MLFSSLHKLIKLLDMSNYAVYRWQLLLLLFTLKTLISFDTDYHLLVPSSNVLLLLQKLINGLAHCQKI